MYNDTDGHWKALIELRILLAWTDNNDDRLPAFFLSFFFLLLLLKNLMHFNDNVNHLQKTLEPTQRSATTGYI